MRKSLGCHDTEEGHVLESPECSSYSEVTLLTIGKDKENLVPKQEGIEFCLPEYNLNVFGNDQSSGGGHGSSQSAIGWITGLPMEELEKVPKELKGSATL